MQVVLIGKQDGAVHKPINLRKYYDYFSWWRYFIAGYHQNQR